MRAILLAGAVVGVGCVDSNASEPPGLVVNGGVRPRVSIGRSADPSSELGVVLVDDVIPGIIDDEVSVFAHVDVEPGLAAGTYAIDEESTFEPPGTAPPYPPGPRSTAGRSDVGVRRAWLVAAAFRVCSWPTTPERVRGSLRLDASFGPGATGHLSLRVDLRSDASCWGEPPRLPGDDHIEVECPIRVP